MLTGELGLVLSWPRGCWHHQCQPGCAPPGLCPSCAWCCRQTCSLLCWVNICGPKAKSPPVWGSRETWGGAGCWRRKRRRRECPRAHVARTEAVPALSSEEDIDWIQQLAELHKLEVVPLVQTFGHVEVGAGSIFGVAGWGH